MNSLPLCNIPDDSHNIFELTYRIDTDQYNDLIKFISGIVDADCWAFVVNNEVIFNKYTEKNFVDKLTNRVFQDKIIEDPRSILMHINYKNKDAIIEIYLFENCPFKYVITYNNKVYNIKKYMSEAYDKAFPLYISQEKDLKSDNYYNLGSI